VDDVVGGLLGLAQGLLLLIIIVTIFDSYTLPTAQPGDLDQLRQLQDLVHKSAIAGGLKDVVVPAFVHLLGILLPSDLVSTYS
jgi:hypothetical protein